MQILGKGSRRSWLRCWVLGLFPRRLLLGLLRYREGGLREYGDEDGIGYRAGPFSFFLLVLGIHQVVSQL